MYGDTANKLALDAKRFQNLPSIPIYQADLVRDIVKEINDLNKDSEYLQTTRDKLQEQNEQGEEEGENGVLAENQKINECQIFVTHLSMRRNKRCLLAYEKVRSDKLVEYAWLNIDPMDNSLQSSTTAADGEGSDTASNTTASTSAAKSSTNSGTSSSKLIPNYTTQLDMNNLNHFEQDFYKNYQDLTMSYKSKFGEYLDLMGDLEPPTDIFIDVRCLKDGGDVTTEYGSFNLIKDSQFYVRKSDVERLIQQGYLEQI
ncbi:uncharacterized protein LODBEIA_P58130 [Lodderomyces beijingensis]|uniref:DNA replication complex GINS protein PSF1 n=1 Tax=Lodderomyces beijingensis TaxID=1775926 RepID=A0ABP0ZTW7_9ASCO